MDFDRSSGVSSGKKEIPVKQGHAREVTPDESDIDDDEEAEEEVEASV